MERTSPTVRFELRRIGMLSTIKQIDAQVLGSVELQMVNPEASVRLNGRTPFAPTGEWCSDTTVLQFSDWLTECSCSKLFDERSANQDKE